MRSPRTLFAVAAIAVTAAVALFFLFRTGSTDPSPGSATTGSAPAEAAVGTPGPAPASAPAPTPSAAPPVPADRGATAEAEAPRPTPVPSAPATEQETREAVGTALAELREVFGPAGSLDYDAAKALVEQRKARVQAIEARLAGMGEPGARESVAAYRAAGTMRERMALVHGLAGNPDPAAAEAMTTLLAEEEGFSMRREIVVALGRSDGPDADQGLVAALGFDDPRVRMAAVAGFAGREGGLDRLAALALSDPAREVRLEAVRVIGVTGGDAALAALAGLTGSEEQRLRIQVVQELARSFGAAALPSLQPLLDDPDVQVRSSVIQALGRIEVDAARELLDRAAQNDPSETVREEARRLLVASAAH